MTSPFQLLYQTLLSALIAASMTHAFAADKVASKAEPSPTDITGTVKVTAEDLIKLIEEKNILLIDSRMQDRQVGYLEGSINLPDVETNCDSLKKTIKSHSTPVAFYCNGPHCGRSAKAVKIAIQCGYTQTFWYRAGFEDWLAKGYPYVTIGH